MDNADLRAYAISTVGNEAGVAFMTWIETKSNVTPEDVVENLKKVRKEVEKMRYDAAQELIASVVNYISKQPEDFITDKQEDTEDIKKAKAARRDNICSWVFDIVAKNNRNLGVGVVQKFKESKRVDVMTTLKKQNPKEFTELVSRKIAEAAK